MIAALMAALVITGCGVPDPVEVTPSATHDFSGRVDTTDNALLLDDRTWWPAGFNAYQLGTDWSINKGCGAEVDLDRYFGALPARSLTRFNLYSSFVVSKDGGLDFAPLDAVFAAANRHDQLVLPVLSGSSGDCEDGVFKDRDYYTDGWRSRIGVGGLTFARWMSIAVSRWRGERSVVGWELVGEPEASVCGSSGCEFSDRSCPPGGAQVLRTFFDTAGAELRRIDSARPIFAGFTGGDQCGLAGTDYLTVGASDGLDVLDFHDYRDSEGVPPAHSSLATRLNQARQLGKPLMLNEVGVKAGSCLSTGQRAVRLHSRVTDERIAGAAGALFWGFVPDPRTTQCTYDIGYGDPAWQVVSELIN